MGSRHQVINSIKDKKILPFLLMFLLVILSSKASVFANSDIALVITLAVFAIVFVLQRSKYFFAKATRPKFTLVKLLGGYALLLVFYYLIFGYLRVPASLRFFAILIFAFCAVNIFRDDFLETFEKVVYALALLSLPLFAAQLVFFDTIFAINELPSKVIPFLDSADENVSSSIVFNILQKAPSRNSGFMWEPGGFSAILAIAAMMNLTINNFTLNRRLIVMLIALLTTLSTTGYLSLLVIGLFVLANNRIRYVIILLPIFIAATLYIANLPFMRDKIQSQVDNRYERVQNYYLWAGHDIVSLGRFGSFIVDFQDFSENYVIGTGFQYTERFNSNLVHVQKTNGLSDYMVKFGSVGMILLIISLSKTFKGFCDKYDTKAFLYFPVLITMLGFSNPILLTPLFICFQVLCLYAYRDAGTVRNCYKSEQSVLKRCYV